MSTWSRALALSSIVLLTSLGGCSMAKVVQQHPALAAASESEYSTVYLIRPRLLKSKGPADGPVRIEYKDEELLTLNEGYYVMLRLKPGDGTIKVHSRTLFTNNSDPIDVFRTQDFRFRPGETYLIHLKQINEEFRGVYYHPVPVDLDTAKLLLRQANASGVASADRIERLKASAAINTDPIHMRPTLPEQVYPDQPYVLEKNPFDRPAPQVPTPAPQP